MILCTTCGAHNDDGTAFCTACNGYLAWVGKPLTPAPEPADEPPTADALPPPAPAERARASTVELGRSDAPTPSPVVGAPAAPVDPDAIGAVVPRAGMPPRPASRARPPASSAGPGPAPTASGADPAPVGAGSAAPGESGASCPSCGAGNADTRRFCRRCGTPLRALGVVATEPAAAGSTGRPPWWRRLAGARGRGSRRQGRMAYNAALGMRSRVFRIVMIMGALGFGVAMVPPWGGDVRGWGFGQLDRLRPATYRAADVKAVALVGAPELEGFASTFAVDGEPTRAWATPWDAAAPPLDREAACPASGAAAGTLQVDFARPVRIDRLAVRAGLDRENPNWATQARPRVLDLVFSDDTCVRVVLEDSAAEQHRSVGVRDVTSVVVRVVDAFPAREGSGAVVALSELTFQAKT